MIRLFDLHKIRVQKELDGLWDFMPIVEVDYNLQPQKYEYKLPVPSCILNFLLIGARQFTERLLMLITILPCFENSDKYFMLICLILWKSKTSKLLVSLFQ